MLKKSKLASLVFPVPFLVHTCHFSLANQIMLLLIWRLSENKLLNKLLNVSICLKIKIVQNTILTELQLT